MIVVRSAGGRRAARRWAGSIADSGQARNAEPTWAAPAPSASAAARPRPSAIPPAAITGRSPTASTTCGTRARVPIGPSSPSTRKLLRWPPASAPWAITASAPSSRRRIASATVVARGDHPDPGVAQRLDRRRRRAGRRRSSRPPGGSRAAPRAGLVEGDRRNLGLGRLAQAPAPRTAARSRSRAADASASPTSGAEWQKKLTLKGRVGAPRAPPRPGLAARPESSTAEPRAPRPPAALDRRRQLRRRGAGHRRLQHRLGDSERRRDRGRGEHVLIMRPGPQRRRGPGGPRRSTSRECVPWRLPRCRERSRRWSVAVSNGPRNRWPSLVGTGRRDHRPLGGARNPRRVGVFTPWWRAICSPTERHGPGARAAERGVRDAGIVRRVEEGGCRGRAGGRRIGAAPGGRGRDPERARSHLQRRVRRRAILRLEHPAQHRARLRRRPDRRQRRLPAGARVGGPTATTR